MTGDPYAPSGDPYAAYDFTVSIDGRTVAGFSAVSGLRMELDTVAYREGGVDDHVHQLPGQFAHANLRLERGLTDQTGFFDWIQAVMGGRLERKTVVLELRTDRRDDAPWGWEFAGAYPVAWSGPDLRASGGGVAVESVELAYERFEALSGRPG